MAANINRPGLEIVAMCTSGYARKLPDEFVNTLADAIDARVAIIVGTAVDAEREACATIADAHDIGSGTASASIQSSTAAEIAALIRKRSQ